MHHGSIPRRSPSTALLFVLCLVLLGACAPIQLVSQYDEVIDTGVTELHKSTTAFLLQMKDAAGTDAGSYASNKAFYIDALSELASLQLRAAASPKNEITTQQLDLLEQNYNELMTIHEAQAEAGLNADIYTPIQTTMDVQFGAILKFEIAKKRGEE